MESDRDTFVSCALGAPHVYQPDFPGQVMQQINSGQIAHDATPRLLCKLSSNPARRTSPASSMLRGRFSGSLEQPHTMRSIMVRIRLVSSGGPPSCFLVRFPRSETAKERSDGSDMFGLGVRQHLAPASLDAHTRQRTVEFPENRATF